MGISFEPYFKILKLDLSSSAQVNSGGGTETQNVKPDAGFIYQIINIYANIPTIGGAAGDHYLTIQNTDGTNTNDIAQNVGTNGATIVINSRYGFASSTETPSGIQQQYDILHNILWANNDEYIAFVYLNNSDTNQTGTRTLHIKVKVFKESV